MGVNWGKQAHTSVAQLRAFRDAIPIGQLVTARDLQRAWNVCERTVYRRIGYLRQTGMIQIKGETGIGYWRTK